MKLLKKLGLVLALGASLALVACGGDNPNDSTSASSNPTCKSIDNWAKISKGLSESKVLSILGSPSQITSTGSAKTFIYESCRGFLTQSDPNDISTQKAEIFGGTIVFTTPNNGFVSTFASPASAKANVVRELSPSEF